MGEQMPHCQTGKSLFARTAPAVFGLCVVALYGLESQAAIVVDLSPVAVGANPVTGFTNGANTQNFAQRIQFSGSVMLSGMDIYTVFGPPSLDGVSIFTQGWFVGDPAVIRLWSDANGHPDTLLLNFTELVTTVDADGTTGAPYYRVHVNFANPISLSAQTTYWIGMSSGNRGGGLWAYFPPPDNDSKIAHFTATTLADVISLEIAFRLYGDVSASSPVPEPASLAIWGLGAFGCAVAGYRRRKAA